ncbi:MAG: DUF1538 domain-containing protein [Mariprofundaceae bacterium]
MKSLMMVALVRPLLISVRDLAPVVMVIAFFQLFILKQPIPHLEEVMAGLLFVLVGLAMFIKGLELALFPLGENMAHTFARKGNLAWLLTFAFLLGFGSAAAEPALIAVAGKAAETVANAGLINTDPTSMEAYAFGLRMSVAAAVGCAILLGVIRILLGWSLPACMIGGYLLIVIATYFAPKEIIGIAYDAGGVTTSTITVPLVTALGVGLASTLRGRNPMLDGFGMIAFAALMPVLFVLIYGMATVA